MDKGNQLKRIASRTKSILDEMEMAIQQHNEFLDGIMGVTQPEIATKSTIQKEIFKKCVTTRTQRTQGVFK